MLHDAPFIPIPTHTTFQPSGKSTWPAKTPSSPCLLQALIRHRRITFLETAVTIASTEESCQGKDADQHDKQRPQNAMQHRHFISRDFAAIFERHGRSFGIVIAGVRITLFTKLGSKAVHDNGIGIPVPRTRLCTTLVFGGVDIPIQVGFALCPSVIVSDLNLPTGVVRGTIPPTITAFHTTLEITVQRLLNNLVSLIVGPTIKTPRIIRRTTPIIRKEIASLVRR